VPGPLDAKAGAVDAPAPAPDPLDPGTSPGAVRACVDAPEDSDGARRSADPPVCSAPSGSAAAKLNSPELGDDGAAGRGRISAAALLPTKPSASTAASTATRHPAAESMHLSWRRLIAARLRPVGLDRDRRLRNFEYRMFIAEVP
jgi:hypothetical protein